MEGDSPYGHWHEGRRGWRGRHPVVDGGGRRSNRRLLEQFRLELLHPRDSCCRGKTIRITGEQAAPIGGAAADATPGCADVFPGGTLNHAASHDEAGWDTDEQTNKLLQLLDTDT